MQLRQVVAAAVVAMLLYAFVASVLSTCIRAVGSGRGELVKLDYSVGSRTPFVKGKRI